MSSSSDYPIALAATGNLPSRVFLPCILQPGTKTRVGIPSLEKCGSTDGLDYHLTCIGDQIHHEVFKSTIDELVDSSSVVYFNKNNDIVEGLLNKVENYYGILDAFL